MKQTIEMIKRRLFEESDALSKADWESLRKDDRKGVRQLLHQWKKLQNREAERKRKYIEMSVYEKEWYERGRKWIAGVDEAGRGPLAGPVVAAAVILKPETPLLGLNDSKQLTERIREELYEQIIESAEAVGVSVIHSGEIDRLNIYQASRLAMNNAVSSLDRE
ncbi:MAG TPA: ribonuclease HII, partial [Bacillales bacterium]|nr:ribonuclease HII [Bacillales bacterium]